MTEDLLIDFSTPGPSRDSVSHILMPTGAPLADPFSPITRQEPSCAENASISENYNGQDNDEDEQRRQAQKKAARRKSLANRRVSFAPEATLHTWSVMELPEDPTSSSASNSTGRQSSMTAAQSPMSQSDTPARSRSADPPTTPTERYDNEAVSNTPESQRSLHQRKRRRSSDTVQSSDDEIMSSPGDGHDSSPIGVEDSIDSESDTDGDTAMSLDEATSNTVRSSDSSSTQTSLDERLRQAATQAGTTGRHDDQYLSADDDDQSMELADGTVTHAFKQYSRPRPSQTHGPQWPDKENVNQFLNGTMPSTSKESTMDNTEHTMGVTMDITRAMGGIVSSSSADDVAGSFSHRRGNTSRRASSGNDTSYGDETMDLTIAKGGILSEADGDVGVDGELSDEEMTMEMTNVVGGLRNPGRNRTTHSLNTEETESMDMTVAAGGILDPITEQTEPQTDIDETMTGAMEMTRAVGKILPQHRDRQGEKQQNDEQEALTPSRLLSQHEDTVTPITKQRMTTTTSDSGSPALKPRTSSRRTVSSSRSSTPKSTGRPASPETRVQTTPSKQLTPLPAKSVSPQRTPVLPMTITQRGTSPRKLFTKELREKASPASRKSPRGQQDVLFSKDENTGLHTPRVVLHAPKPHQHLVGKSGTTGIHAKGQGSPRVSEILARRSSIGDMVPEFQLQSGSKRYLRFEDPQQMAREMEAERIEEHRRESGRFMMEQEVDEQHEENTTQNLRGMIDSMTPKKDQSAKLRGRKSLAVGSAKGLLGKRPAELDIDEDDDDGENTPKRLKAVFREGSPVKKIHLPKPPTKEQTTGRLTKAEQSRLSAGVPPSDTPTLSRSPPKGIKSPDHTGHFRHPTSHQKPQSFEARLDNVMGATDASTTHPDPAREADDEKISLQQFLTMTNIHFIELSTTKRRHTVAPTSDDFQSAIDADNTSKAIFIAAATTLPLLELYQHASRELKSSISSGRKIIRAIESEILADQPAIFKKYVDARPDQKAIMDNQFRNAKTNARLQSKEGWYSWRGQLVDGLHSGLEGVKLNLEKDEQTLVDQQTALEDILPQYHAKQKSLEQQLSSLRKRLSDLESFDRATLQVNRQKLVAKDREISQKSSHLSKLQQQLEEKKEVLSQASELRQEMSDQIEEALRVQEEQSRWHSSDVSASKTRVEKLEHESGWRLLTAEEETEEPNDLGVALTLRYKDQLRLFFYPSAFQPKSDLGRRRSGRRARSVSGPNAPISLTYSPEEAQPGELPTELRFFLQLIQSQLHAFSMMPKGAITCQTLLKTVSEGWALAERTAQEIRRLRSTGIVNVSIQGDEKLSARLMLMREDRSRFDIDFALTVLSLDGGEFSATTSVTAAPVYGPLTSKMDASKIRKIQHALTKETETKSLGQDSWVSAVRGFEDWLQTQALAEKTQAAAKAKMTKSQDQSTATRLPRATTQSPQRPDRQANNSTTPKVPPRSPLAPRTTNTQIQKKTLPVPKKPVTLSSSQAQEQSAFSASAAGREANQQKENIVPGGGAAKITNHTAGADGPAHVKLMSDLADDVFGGSQPAITPEMQEAMMHTPMKRRVGALRRSPI